MTVTAANPVNNIRPETNFALSTPMPFSYFLLLFGAWLFYFISYAMGDSYFNFVFFMMLYPLQINMGATTNNSKKT